MSRVVIRMEQPGRSDELFLRLRDTLGLPFSEAKAKLQPGEILLECLLFERDHDDVVVQLRALLNDIEQTRSTVTVFELPYDQPFETCPDPERYIITPAILWNILDEHDA